MNPNNRSRSKQTGNLQLCFSNDLKRFPVPQPMKLSLRIFILTSMIFFNASIVSLDIAEKYLGKIKTGILDRFSSAKRGDGESERDQKAPEDDREEQPREESGGEEEEESQNEDGNKRMMDIMNMDQKYGSSPDMVPGD